jgi:hypothetical protein
MPVAGSPHRLRWQWWLLLLALALVASAGFTLALRPPRSAAPPPKAGPLDGKLTVLVRPPARTIEPVSIEEPGALPVRSGGAMCLDAHLNQPAFTYLVWLDSEGHVLPLYPWNNERLEIKDINEPPPLRRAGNLVFSPLLGGNWTFGKRGGMETILLLARPTPLPEGTKLGSLLDPLPPATKMHHPQELVVMGLAGGDTSVSMLLERQRSGDPEAQTADESLRALLVRLGGHFDLIRAIRFAHQGE